VFIGIARFEIFIPSSASLKDKRQVLRKVTQVVRNKFNVSIAEVDYQDLWQRAALGVTCVAESVGHCRKVLQEVEKAVGRAAIDGAEIVDRSLEVVSAEDLV
jgi:uncharacterized protein YlxP (DUF503 family)